MARPGLITPAREERMLGAFAMGAGQAIAAKIIGVTQQAVSYHIKHHPEFRERVMASIALADDNVTRSLYRAARNGNVVAMIFWLKNRRPSDWRDRRAQNYEEEGPQGGVRSALRELMDRISRGELEKGNGPQPAEP